MLVYTLEGSNTEEKLMTTSLQQVDNSTRLYANPSDLRNSIGFRKQIDSYEARNKEFMEENPYAKGKFKVYFIEDNANKEEVDILFNDTKPISIKTNHFTTSTMNTEVEDARKLLFSSKDKRFLRACMEKDWFRDTTGHLIKLKPNETEELTRSGYKPITQYNAQYADIETILKYALDTPKLSFMRDLVEDSLEIWKEKIEYLRLDLLYYYSRNLRMVINSYHASLNRTNRIYNLSAYPNTVRSVMPEKGRISKIFTPYGITVKNDNKVYHKHMDIAA